MTFGYIFCSCNLITSIQDFNWIGQYLLHSIGFNGNILFVKLRVEAGSCCGFKIKIVVLCQIVKRVSNLASLNNYILRKENSVNYWQYIYNIVIVSIFEKMSYVSENVKECQLYLMSIYSCQIIVSV